MTEFVSEPVLDRVFRSSDTLRLYFQVLQSDPVPTNAVIQIIGEAGGLLLGMDVPVEDDKRFKVDQILPLDRLQPGLSERRLCRNDFPIDARFTCTDQYASHMRQRREIT